jgi:hypothetical protein
MRYEENVTKLQLQVRVSNPQTMLGRKEKENLGDTRNDETHKYSIQIVVIIVVSYSSF